MKLLDNSSTMRLSEENLDDLIKCVGEGQIIEIKPFEGSEKGIKDTIEMYRAFHSSYETSLWMNVSPTNSFELWYDGESVRTLMYIGDKTELKRAVNHIISNFPGARVVLPDNLTKYRLPEMKEGEYVAGARLKLKTHHFAPIRNPNGVEDFIDPYVNLIEDMVDQTDVREVIQVLFKPAGDNWTSPIFGQSANEYADNLKMGEAPSPVNEDEEPDQPSEITRARNNIKTQVDQPGFYINIRVLAISKKEKIAEEKVDTICRTFREYYREWTGQTLVADKQYGGDLWNLLRETVGRTGRNMDWAQAPIKALLGNREPIIMTIPELASLAHIPTSVDHSAIKWEVLDSRNRLPSIAPKYNEYRKKPKNPEKPFKPQKNKE